MSKVAATVCVWSPSAKEVGHWLQALYKTHVNGYHYYHIHFTYMTFSVLQTAAVFGNGKTMHMNTRHINSSCM